MEELNPETYELKEIPSFLVSSKQEENKLYNTVDKFELKISSESIQINLQEAYFLNYIEIDSNFIDIEKIRISGSDIFTNSNRIFPIEEIKSDDSKFYKISINTIISKLVFSYDSGWLNFDKITINAMRFHGVPLIEIESLIEPLSKIKQYKNEIENQIAIDRKKIKDEKSKHQTEVTELSQKVTELTTSFTSKTQEVNTIEESINKLKADLIAQESLNQTKTEALSKTEINLQQREKELNEIESKSRLLDAQNKKLNTEILEKQSNLRTIKNESALYSNELASFSKQGNKYLWAYGFFSIVPSAVLITIVVNLYNSTLTFIEIIALLTLSKVSDVIILKLPSVLISSGIITACYYILKLLILKIFDIQAEKLTFSKLSIIAHNNVNLSASELNLTPEQLLEANIYLRMDLLKNYMTKEIDRDYKYAMRDQELLDNVINDSIGKKVFNYFFKPKKEVK
ncbi:hypothetical protein JWG41_09375 [Leptospira sp. 201903075]|uniref:hypothetical protein n=1 Tax=Leptospira chreensis TaxID=2810035 RepID=UPI0019667394|nr:hypothetical protein [Leptospira chreensis]MBM9590652.1 hypothetical protein [Leptospira chreensis]